MGNSDLFLYENVVEGRNSHFVIRFEIQNVLFAWSLRAKLGTFILPSEDVECSVVRSFMIQKPRFLIFFNCTLNFYQPQHFDVQNVF